MIKSVRHEAGDSAKVACRHPPVRSLPTHTLCEGLAAGTSVPLKLPKPLLLGHALIQGRLCRGVEESGEVVRLGRTACSAAAALRTVAPYAASCPRMRTKVLQESHGLHGQNTHDKRRCWSTLWKAKLSEVGGGGGGLRLPHEKWVLIVEFEECVLGRAGGWGGGEVGRASHRLQR